jgi:O-antigen/teichoic acid export membrane protein
MGVVQKDAFRTMVISYLGIILGYLNKGLLFLIILTTEQIGLVNLLVSVGTLFAQFANLGTIYTTWKFFPFFKNKEKNNHGFLSLMLLFVFIGIVLCTSMALLFRGEIEALYIDKSKLFVDYFIWIFPIGISYVLYLVFEMFLRGFLKNVVSVFALEIVLRGILTILLLLLWAGWISFGDFVVYQSLSYFVPLFLLMYYTYKIGELNLNIKDISISKRFRKILVQFSLFNYFNTLGSVIVISLDVMMVAQMVGLTGTGIYTTVVFLTSALQIPYKSITRITSPMVASFWKNKQMKEMNALYKKVSSVTLFLSFGAFVLIWLNIDFLFSFLKPEFQEGIQVFLYLMIGRLVDMYFGLNGAIFITSKKYKYDLVFTFLLIVIVFFMNLWLIPIYGITGAAISTAVGLIAYNLSRVIFVYLAYQLQPFNFNQFKVIFVGGLCLLIGTNTGNLFDNKWVQATYESLLFLGVFIFPIYWYNLEPDVISYTKKGTSFLMQKFRVRK